MLGDLLEPLSHIRVGTGMLHSLAESRPGEVRLEKIQRFWKCVMARQSPAAASGSAREAFPPLIVQPFTAQESVPERLFLSPTHA